MRAFAERATLTRSPVMGRREDGAGIDVQHKPEGGLDDTVVPVRVKLSLLWVSVMLCYIYCDYFELYVPGKLQSMLEGRMGPLGVITQSVLLGTSVLMAIPSLMVFLSIALPPTLSRLANIVFGIMYSIIMLVVVLYPTWVFYRFFGILEIALTLLVVWYAWTWPERIRREARTVTER
jgi:uncharacterized protein DUF6326